MQRECSKEPESSSSCVIQFKEAGAKLKTAANLRFVIDIYGSCIDGTSAGAQRTATRKRARASSLPSL
jgi:hypothetical protein